MVLGFEDDESYRKSSATLCKSMNEEKEKVKNLTAMHEEEEKIEVRNKEPITLPYSTWLFESILQLVKEEKAANEEEAKECSPCCFQY